MAQCCQGWGVTAFVPKIVTVFREGYRLSDFRADALAGLTVAIVALPLSMALAIASGATPDKGLIAVVVGGLLVSLLSGSRYQVGGPAGAFIVIVYGIVDAHGYDGLLLATLMAGALMVLFGILRMGSLIRFVPRAVITGFTAGIAVIILTSQIKDIFGLQIEKMPADFTEKMTALWAARDTVNLWATLMTFAALAMIVVLRRYTPRWPSLLMAVASMAAVVSFFELPVTTIGTAFGGIPSSLPMPRLPEITPERLLVLFPSALTIALLSGIESLLCATVADGMTGRRHRSNCELVGQGIANIASPLFGGLPVTGTIARTATNVKAGARSPVAGILHALFVLVFMLALAPLASTIPLGALAAVLVMVAWNMAEPHLVMATLRGPCRDEAAVMALTFLLTVLTDLTVGIGAGLAAAALFHAARKKNFLKP